MKRIKELSKKYNEHLKSLGIENENGCLSNMMDCPPSKKNSLLHARWMCYVLSDSPQEMEKEKAMRWLGFIQGVLYAHDIFTIDEMRDDVRQMLSQE